MANIVLNTKTYGGRGVVNGLASYLDATTGLLSAFRTLSASIRLPSRKGEKANIQWRLKFPIPAADPSACACPGDIVDEADVYIQVRVSQGVSEAVRTDLATQVKDLTARAEFTASIVSFTQPTG